MRLTLTKSKRLCGMEAPSIWMSALKNQWRECSELDCAMSNSSTFVGSRFTSSLNMCV